MGCQSRVNVLCTLHDQQTQCVSDALIIGSVIGIGPIITYLWGVLVSVNSTDNAANKWCMRIV